MTQTQVVIVYSPNWNKKRRVIIPTDDSEIPIHQTNILPGESVLTGTISDFSSIGPDAMLANFTGQQPGNDRCVYIDENNIVQMIVAGDPSIDTILPNGISNMIATTTALRGWVYNPPSLGKGKGKGGGGGGGGFSNPITIVPVSDQTNNEEDSISLQISATQANGLALTYSSDGLPTGISIDAVAGLISGIVVQGASANSPYPVTITVTDTNQAQNDVQFNWDINS